MALDHPASQGGLRKPPLEARRRRIQDLGRELLQALGYDPGHPSIKDTPARWAKWWTEFVEFDPGKLDTAFESVASDQLVLVSGINVWSLCEHHLLPFSADVSIAYIIRDKAIGLSKLARVAHKHAHAIQIQERLVDGIAQEVQALTNSPDVAVLAHGRHLCMAMRGVRTPATMTTSALRGRFLEDPATRREFLTLAPCPDAS